MKEYKKVYVFKIEEGEFDTLRDAVELGLRSKENYNRRQTVNLSAKLNEIAEGKSEYERTYH